MEKSRNFDGFFVLVLLNHPSLLEGLLYLLAFSFLLPLFLCLHFFLGRSLGFSFVFLDRPYQVVVNKRREKVEKVIVEVDWILWGREEILEVTLIIDRGFNPIASSKGKEGYRCRKRRTKATG